jgi:hypothetical protein
MVRRLVWWLSAAAILAFGAAFAAMFAVRFAHKLSWSPDGFCNLERPVANLLFVALWMILFTAGSLALADMAAILVRIATKVATIWFGTAPLLLTQR